MDSAPLRTGLLAFFLATTVACKGSRATALAADSAPAEPAGSTVDAATQAWADAAPADEAVAPTTSDELDGRARHLLEAISKDDADLATDILFPRAAWLALRDVSDPAADWSKRVDRAFRRAVHVLSKRAEGSQFVSLELGHAIFQAPVKRHGWKKALWSVRGSRLTYVVDGHTRTVPIREMTAWRGAWYVTRLR